MYIKITNLANAQGQCDYKGLNINQFIAGSQVYDLANNIALIKTSENVTIVNADITILTEADYNTQKQQIETAQKTNQPKSEVEELKSRVDLMQKALDDLTMGGN